MKNTEDKFYYYSSILMFCSLILAFLVIGYHAIENFLYSKEVSSILIGATILSIVAGVIVFALWFIFTTAKEYKNNK